MPEPPNDDIDEVALNVLLVLLADGLDVLTALEASRRNGGRESDARGCMGATILLVVTVLAIVVLFSEDDVRLRVEFSWNLLHQPQPSFSSRPSSTAGASSASPAWKSETKELRVRTDRADIVPLASV